MNWRAGPLRGGWSNTQQPLEFMLLYLFNAITFNAWTLRTMGNNLDSKSKSILLMTKPPYWLYLFSLQWFGIRQEYSSRRHNGVGFSCKAPSTLYHRDMSTIELIVCLGMAAGNKESHLSCYLYTHEKPKRQL